MKKLSFLFALLSCNAATAQWCNEFGAPTKFMVLESDKILTVETNSGRFVFAIADTLDRENYKSYQLKNELDNANLTLYYGRNLEDLQQQGNFEQAVFYYKNQTQRFYFCPLVGTPTRKIKEK